MDISSQYLGCTALDTGHRTYLRDTVESFTKSVFFSIAEGKLPSPELVLMLIVDRSGDTSNCCFLSPDEKMSRDVDFEPRLDEVLVKFSETHFRVQTS